MDENSEKNKKSSRSKKVVNGSPLENNMFVKNEEKGSFIIDKKLRNLNEEMLSNLKILVSLGIAILVTLIVGIGSLWFALASNNYNNSHQRMMEETYLNQLVDDYLLSTAIENSYSQDRSCLGGDSLGSSLSDFDSGIYSKNTFRGNDSGIYSNNTPGANDPGIYTQNNPYNENNFGMRQIECYPENYDNCQISQYGQMGNDSCASIENNDYSTAHDWSFYGTATNDGSTATSKIGNRG